MLVPLYRTEVSLLFSLICLDNEKAQRKAPKHYRGHKYTCKYKLGAKIIDDINDTATYIVYVQ